VSFAEAWAKARHVEGWLTDGQGRALWDAARAVPPGSTLVEIGSFRGRSAIVLASAMPDRCELVCVDPYLGSDRGPQELDADPGRGAADLAAFRANVVRAGVAEQVRQVRARSADALGEVPGEIALLWVDGAHRFGPARDDMVRWGAKVADGGAMLVHDAFSSIGVTLALLTSVAADGRWRYEGRERSLARYRRVAAPRGAQLAAHAAQLPWFGWNVGVKAAIVAACAAVPGRTRVEP
jgi:hypothetical protein